MASAKIWASIYLDYDHDSYWALLRKLIVADHDPENVILMEIDPQHQKTLPDFNITQRKLGIAVVDILTLKKRGKRLYYTKDGREIEVRRIYNRCIVDELERKDITLPFDLREELDVEWAGHPNWYFRISKFSIPYLQHRCVPKTWFVDENPVVPSDNQNYLLKPLYSFAGVGIKFAPTEADIDAIPAGQRHDYILQERMRFEPVIADAARPHADGDSHDVRLAGRRRIDASATAHPHGARHDDGRRPQQESGVGRQLGGPLGLKVPALPSLRAPLRAPSYVKSAKRLTTPMSRTKCNAFEERAAPPGETISSLFAEVLWLLLVSAC